MSYLRGGSSSLCARSRSQLRQPSAIQEVGDITSRHPYPPRNDLHLDPALTATANLSAERAHITLPPPPGPGLPGLIGAEG